MEEGSLAVGREALARVDPADDPLFAAAIVRYRRREEIAPSGASALVELWSGNRIGGPRGALRYRWPISTRYLTRVPPCVPHPSQWRAWRPAEEGDRQTDPARFEARLVVPSVVIDALELLAELGETGDELAGVLLDEALPTARRDMGFYLSDRHAWMDTFALWCLAHRPHALRLLHPFALATADAYAARARSASSIGEGSRFPFHGVPLVSVSAQLASGLLALGFHPQLTGHLAGWVADHEDGAGGWGDANGPVDPLTTLVAADLLAGLDPAWDPLPTCRALERLQRRHGLWTAFGPETAWLSIEIVTLLERLGRPFEARFRWPQLATTQTDRRTGLPFLAYLADLARLFAEVPALGAAPVELAFLDLAGFREWNNRFGMATGDEVLRFIAVELAALSDSVAVRDGGDEFVVLGSPGATGLGERLDALRFALPARFRARFGDGAQPVAMRILHTRVRAAELIAARDWLGAEIGRLKEALGEVGEQGVRVELTTAGAAAGAAAGVGLDNVSAGPVRGDNG